MYKFVFSCQQLQLISEALSRLPYGIVVSLINNINEQIEEQKREDKENTSGDNSSI